MVRSWLPLLLVIILLLGTLGCDPVDWFKPRKEDPEQQQDAGQRVDDGGTTDAGDQPDGAGQGWDSGGVTPDGGTADGAVVVKPDGSVSTPDAAVADAGTGEDAGDITADGGQEPRDAAVHQPDAGINDGAVIAPDGSVVIPEDGGMTEDGGDAGNVPLDGSAVIPEDGGVTEDGGDAGLAQPDGSVVIPVDGGGGDAGPELDVGELVRAMDGVTVMSETPGLDGTREFELLFEQPVDHFGSGGPTFQQYVVLIHRDRQAPVVLGLDGYWLMGTGQELTYLLGANELAVEHRFFGGSVPQDLDWTKLTIQQAAEDHHRIVMAFKPIYRGKWISTGASKGGMTSMYHRRFHPDDVDATVPYVAPNSLGAPDERYNAFLATVGDAACRQRLMAFQRAVLTRREAMMERVTRDVQQLSCTLIEMPVAFEHAVIESCFAFWQYSDASMCGTIPDSTAFDDVLYSVLGSLSGLPDWYCDDWLGSFVPYYYQAAAQLGYPASYEKHLEDLLVYPGTNVANTYLPPGVTVTYDGTAMPDVAHWLDTQGFRIMFIYGEYDPWTAGAFQMGSAQDSFLFMVPGGNHGAAISLLAEPERTEALMVLERWMGVSITPVPPPPSLLKQHAQRARLRFRL